MKKILIIAGIVVVAGAIAWGVWSFILPHGQPGGGVASSSYGSLPSVTVQTPGGASVLVRGVASPQDPVVAKDFLGQIQNADQIALGGTVVASPYALQIWGDENKGGEALLLNASSGWVLVSLGGGEWTALALIQEGVPHDAALQLVAGLGGTAPAGKSISVPPGDTLTLGTAKGSVTMKNFYKNPVYLADTQQSVVVRQDASYAIVYDIPGNRFTLNLFGASFGASRQTAEAGLLDVLGINEQDACRLNVYESASGLLFAAHAGQSLTLSFCPSNLP